MSEPATRRALWATLALALAPLLLQLPATVALGVIATAIAMAVAGTSRNLRGWIKLPVTLVAVLAVFAAFDFSIGRDTGCALLAAMLAIKPAETRSVRDARSLVGFALFAPFATFLLDQGPASLLLGLAATLATLATLQRLADVEAGIAPAPVLSGLAGIARLAAIGLPLTLAAFWLFPRIPTPLWGVPDRATSTLGLSDSMAPGDWLDLMVDDSPAMRVRFDGPPPATSDMYWRGPVLWDFDGRTWSGSREPEPSATPAVTPGPTTWRYRLEIEPSERRYITALDLPLAAAPGSERSPDGDLLAPAKLQAVTRWTLASARPATFQPELDDAERRRALAFPRDHNPRAQHLARRWQQETGGDPAAIVQRAMAMVNAELAYSLAPPALGRDTVDEFLFQTRTGYCEHFSSAFVFLMRSAGVPSRVVTGYAGGYRNPVGDYWIVRNSDAHAWAEVWLAGRGWVRVDPTAAVAPERIYDTVADRMPGRIPGFEGVQVLTRAWNVTDFLRTGWNDFVLGFNAERQARMFRALGIDRLGPTTLVAVFALVAAAAIGWMGWWLARGERERDPLLRAWHALSARYRRHGLAREAHESAGDWAERVARQRPADAEAIRTLARRFSDARYMAATESRKVIDALRAFRPSR